MKWNFDIDDAEKEKIVAKFINERVSKGRLKRIAKRLMICQRMEGKLNYTVLRIPVAGDGFQTDGTIFEVENLEDSDSAICSKTIITIDDEKGEQIAEATGFEFSLLAFLTETDTILDPLDAESYRDISAGMIMFNKLFPKAAPTGEAHDAIEKKIEHDLITKNPAMIWPQLFGSPYNENRVKDILSVIEDDDDLMFDDVLIITDMFLYPSKCKQAGEKIISSIISIDSRFLYMTCDVAVDGKFDSSMENEMISLAEKNEMIVEGNEAQGYYAIRIDESYLKRIEGLDARK